MSGDELPDVAITAGVLTFEPGVECACQLCGSPWWRVGPIIGTRCAACGWARKPLSAPAPQFDPSAIQITID